MMLVKKSINSKFCSASKACYSHCNQHELLHKVQHISMLHLFFFPQPPSIHAASQPPQKCSSLVFKCDGKQLNLYNLTTIIENITPRVPAIAFIIMSHKNNFHKNHFFICDLSVIRTLRCIIQELVDSFSFCLSGNNPMNIPAGGITTDQQPPNLISESALPTSLGATK